jgi:error-prone DNA polymerase
MGINGLQENTVLTILDERKAGDFKSLQDFLTRVDLNFSDAMALVNAGCFAGLNPELSHKEIAYQIARYCLSDGSVDSPARAPVTTPLSRQEIRELEIKTFRFPVSSYPLEPYHFYLRGRVKKASDIPRHVGQTIHLAGVYITRKETQTRRRDPMEFLTLEDETDTYECVLFPAVFREFGDLLHWETLFILRGKVEESFGVYTITIEKLASLPGVVQKQKRLAQTR